MVKEKHIYSVVSTGIACDKIIVTVLKMRQLSVGATPFTKCKTVGEVVSTLKGLNKDVKGDINERVTSTINHLLHYFLEPFHYSYSKLQAYGEEIYGCAYHLLTEGQFESYRRLANCGDKYADADNVTTKPKPLNNKPKGTLLGKSPFDELGNGVRFGDLPEGNADMPEIIDFINRYATVHDSESENWPF